MPLAMFSFEQSTKKHSTLFPFTLFLCDVCCYTDSIMNTICFSVVTSNILTESSFVPLSHETFPEHNIKRFSYHHHSKAKSATSSLSSTASIYSTFPCDNCFPSVNISLSSYYYVQAMKNGGMQYLRHLHHHHHDQQTLPPPASSSYLTSYMFTSWGKEGAGPDPISEDTDWSFKFRD